ncbi:MAG TPA: serine/threonine protein kinase [Candidatus Desulfobacillus sp.]|nr:serine/threonine protein kinase [Candidatus Desulfobacillus sp.]
MITGAHPFSALTPEVVLAALEGVGLACSGSLLALNSYENRVYQAGLDEGAPVVAKFYRPGRWSDEAILEEHAFAAELAAAEIPVVAPLRLGGATLHHDGGFRFTVFPRRGGRAPEFERPGTLQWMGRFLGRLHAVGARRPFAARPSLDLAGFGEASRDFLLARDFIPADLRAAWRSVADQALEAARHCYERAGPVAAIRLHGDCHAGNILWIDEGAAPGPHFVDFDDCRMGPAVQDLWMLLSGERDDMARQLGEVLDGYEDFRELDRRELHLVEALRTLRLLHYSAWLARRWDDPAFPAAFPWFNTQHYWQDRILELREQVALMQEPPLPA